MSWEAKEGRYVSVGDAQREGRVHFSVFIHSCHCVFVCEWGEGRDNEVMALGEV